MTILDAQSQLASAFAPTAVGTQVNGNYFDAGASEDLGKGNDILWYTRVGTSFTTGAGATVQFILQGNATDSTFASGNVTILQAPMAAAVAAATLTAGTEFKFKIPRGVPLRYYRLGVVIGTGVLTAGAVDSWIAIDDMQDNISYPAAYTVL
jgi:hypothetical protein